MDKFNLLILDDDSFYINNFYNYILENYKEKIIAVSFSKKENLNQYLQQENNIDVVFSNKEFYECNKEVFDNKIVIILGDKNNIREELPEVKKYQSAETICNYLIEIVENKKKNLNSVNSKVVSFYSPIGGVGNTITALSTALKLSMMTNKVLYLNFENTQSFVNFIAKDKGKYNTSDLLISLKEDNEDFEKIIVEGVFKYRNTNLFYLNPVESILDFEDLTLEDVTNLINRIKELAIYDYIIFDFPSNINTKYFNILDMSVSVFVLMKQDNLSIFKVDSMLRQLDNVKNFKFIYNFYDADKEKLISKMIVNNKLPIIGEIPYYEDIYGLCSLEDISKSKYFKEIDKIIEEL